jgi:hypothetical protein
LKVKVLVNGQPMALWALEDRPQWLRLAIPGTGRLGLEIAFEVEGQSRIGIMEASIDNDTLFHNVLKMRRWIWAVFAGKVRQLAPRNRISAGEEIFFHPTGEGPWLATQGWGLPEPWGMPMEGNSAKLSMVLPRHISNPLILRVHARMLPLRERAEGQLIVEVQGKSSATWTVIPGPSEWFEVPIPTARRWGQLGITFKMKQAPFGFGIERLLLVEAPEAPQK